MAAQRGQARKKYKIRRRKSNCRWHPWIKPCECLVLQTTRLFFRSNFKKLKCNCVCFVQKQCSLYLHDLQPQLFLQLTLKSLLGQFSRFNLATWKFPEPTVVFMRGALANQNSPIPPQNRCNNEYQSPSQGRGSTVSFRRRTSKKREASRPVPATVPRRAPPSRSSPVRISTCSRFPYSVKYPAP